MSAGPAALAQLFCESLRTAGGQGRVLGSRPEALSALDELVGGRPAVVDGHPDLAGIDVGAVQDPWEAEVGVTGVFVAVADTGTLALVAGPATPRRTSLVPPVHVALVPFSRLRETLADALADLASLDPTPSNMQFITGPSRSGDIELRLVQGMHGPKAVHVLLYPDEAAPGQ